MTTSSVAARPNSGVVPVPESARDHRQAVGFDTRILWRITTLALRYRLRMTLAIIGTICAALVQITIPRLIGDAVDHIHGLLASADTVDIVARAALWDAALLLCGAAAFRGICTMLQNYQGEAVGHLLAHRLRIDYYAQLQRLSFSYHDHIHTGELMTRGILDIEGTRLWIHTGVLRIIFLVILLGGGAWMLASFDIVLAGIALAFVPFVGIGTAIARLKLRTLWYRLQEELGILTQVMEENLAGIRVVRAFASHAFELARFDAISHRALAILHRRIAIFVASTTTMTFAFFLSMALVLWIGGERVILGQLTVGELTHFLAFMTLLQQPVRQIAWAVNAIARASTCGARLFEILDLEPDIRDRPDAQSLVPSDGILAFEDVSFSYHGTGTAPPALSRVSFAVKSGHVLGIVGPPGSGKSTIAHLIARYYDVSAGRITIDGIDIRDVTLESLRGYVSIIQQDAYVFTAAIETNIVYGDPWADRSAIRRATEAAQLHQYIAHLPEQYGTLVGERGVSLSGGQRQRLAIARGVLPDAGIIVFDDSTAAVDAGTEQRIRTALTDVAVMKATIIIAHRLSSLMHADEILFLEDGKVIERGDHATLLAMGGRYATLHALQTGPFETEA